MTDLDRSTKIPLVWVGGAVAFGLPLLTGAVLWLASVDSKATEAKDSLVDIRERLIRIEGKLDQRGNK